MVVRRGIPFDMSMEHIRNLYGVPEAGPVERLVRRLVNGEKEN